MRRRVHAFTLIELLVVISIIGVLGTVMIPRFINLRNRSLEAAAQTFGRDVTLWIAAADAAGSEPTDVVSCGPGEPKIIAEGAPSELPSFIQNCTVSYSSNSGHFTVDVTTITNSMYQFYY